MNTRLFLALFLFYGLNVTLISSQEIITLTSPEQYTKTHKASEKVLFKNGYTYKPFWFNMKLCG